jgi:hypothetical protein
MSVTFPTSGMAINELSISEIERLAKAGVTLTVETVRPVSDPAGEYPTKPPTLSDLIWERYTRAIRAANNGRDFPGYCMPFELLATNHGDTTWVSVHPTNFNYEPFQLTDVAAIFPSDALMAKLALWEREHL